MIIRDEEMAESEEPSDADERENSALRKKLFDLNVRLMIAEELTREAEGVAQKQSCGRTNTWK